MNSQITWNKNDISARDSKGIKIGIDYSKNIKIRRNGQWEKSSEKQPPNLG